MRDPHSPRLTRYPKGGVPRDERLATANGKRTNGCDPGCCCEGCDPFAYRSGGERVSG